MNRGGSRGGFRGGARGGRGGGRGGYANAGPPDTVMEMGTFVHACEDEMVCSSTMADKVPYFNAPIYLQNKSVIGKVDEILGPINEVYFSVKMEGGVVASSFQKGDKVFIGGDKLLPIDRFLPKPKVAGGVTKRGRGGGRGAPGGFRGRGAPRGAPRGGGRGGFQSRGAPRGGGFSSRGGGGFSSRGGGGGRGGSSWGGGGGGGRGGYRGS